MYNLIFILFFIKLSESDVILYRSITFDGFLYITNNTKDELNIYNDNCYVDTINGSISFFPIISAGEYHLEYNQDQISNIINITPNELISFAISPRRDIYYPPIKELAPLTIADCYYILLQTDDDSVINQSNYTYNTHTGFYKSKISYNKENVMILASELNNLTDIISILILPVLKAIPDKLNPIIDTAMFRSFDAPTPLFTQSQHYLNSDGINYYEFQKLTGNQFHGATARIHVYDGGMLSHEDLTNVQIKSNRDCTPPEDCDHGTAAAGLIGATHNEFGINGIAYDARIFFHDMNYLDRILEVTKPGDIISMSMGLPDMPMIGDKTYRRLISQLLSNNVIVILAAGNESKDYKQHIAYQKTGSETDPTIKYVILAGSCNSLTFKKSSFTNYNSIYNIAYTWGDSITTTGYGTLQQSDNLSKRYSNNFSGTSASTPIISGAIAVIQDYSIRVNNKYLKPMDVVEMLKSMKDHSEIGTRIDLVKMMHYVNNL